MDFENDGLRALVIPVSDTVVLPGVNTMFELSSAPEAALEGLRWANSGQLLCRCGVLLTPGSRRRVISSALA